ncbi:hypothetical protein ACFT56_26575, partial [Streptomyces cinereoruber]
MARLEWIRLSKWVEVEFGTSRAGAVQVPLYCTADIDAPTRPEIDIDWEKLHQVGKGWPSPLAALCPKTKARRRRDRCRGPADEGDGRPEV